MAQKVQIVLEDDIDGGEASETVSFGLDGTRYEIDLHERNARALRDALAMYVGHARRVGSGSRGGRSSSSSDGSPGAREIRDWARSNGIAVTSRGRVSAEVREAYVAAH
jgi:hypothetical protein